MGRQRKTRRLVCVFLLIMLVLGIIFAVTFAIVNMTNLEEEHLPEMKLYLNGTTLTDIYENGKEVKYEGNKLLLIDGEKNWDVEGVEIKGRGNMTWNQIKKPLSIKLPEKVGLAEMSKSRKWYLLANKLDDSSLRNDLSFYLAREIGMKYVMQGKFVELSVDDEWQGLYYLTTPVRIGKQLVDLRDEDAILVEFDKAYCEQEDYYYQTKENNCLAAKDVINDDRKEKLLLDFGKQFEKLEKAINAKDYERIKELIDVKSFAEYAVLNTFVMNPDGFFTSFYMYRDGDGKIYAGPVWDFDGAFGNRSWWGKNVPASMYAPRNFMSRRERALSEGEQSLSKTMYYLVDMPEFQEEMRMIYVNMLAGKNDEMMEYINVQVKKMREVAIEDNEKWKKGDFDEETVYLKWWIEERFQLFDEIFRGEMLIPIDELGA